MRLATTTTLPEARVWTTMTRMCSPTAPHRSLTSPKMSHQARITGAGITSIRPSVLWIPILTMAIAKAAKRHSSMQRFTALLCEMVLNPVKVWTLEYVTVASIWHVPAFYEITIL